VSSVFSLTANCSSLTVNFVVTLRKFLSLLLSVIYFDNDFTALHWLGTFLVFTGTLLFTDVLPLCYSHCSSDAVVQPTVNDEGSAQQAVVQQSVPTSMFTDNVMRRRITDSNAASDAEYLEVNRCAYIDSSVASDGSDKMLSRPHVNITASDANDLHENLPSTAVTETVLTCRVFSDATKDKFSEFSSTGYDGNICDGQFKSS